MLCIAFIVCLALLPRRIREGLPIAVPVGVIALGLVRCVLLVVTVFVLTASFRRVAHASPDDKATVLQAETDEAMAYGKFGMGLELPLLIAAWFGDRALLKRHRPTHSPAPAPSGASCATHTSKTATVICSRCGGFMCAECGENVALCTSCRAR